MRACFRSQSFGGGATGFLGLPVPSLDAAVISHAHLDHCGYLPALVRQGFNGPVFMTADTAALADRLARQRQVAGRGRQVREQSRLLRTANPKPCDLDDVERTLPLFRTVDFDASVAVADEISVRLVPAGHILGSTTGDHRCGTVVFSGDLGRRTIRCCVPPPPPAADARSLWSRPMGTGCTCPTRRTTSRTRSPPRSPGRVGGDPGLRGRPHRNCCCWPSAICCAPAGFRGAGLRGQPHGASGLQVYRDALGQSRGDLRPDLPEDLLEIATCTQRIQQPNPRH